MVQRIVIPNLPSRLENQREKKGRVSWLRGEPESVCISEAKGIESAPNSAPCGQLQSRAEAERAG